MDFLRGKLRGKTPSWGRESEAEARAPLSRSSRRESGSSFSSLWSRSSKIKPDKPNNWSYGEDLRSSSYRPYRMTQSPKVTRFNYNQKYSNENFSPASRYSDQSSNINQMRPDRGSNVRVVSPVQQRRTSLSYVVANETLDYKTLFERERQEREMYEKKLQDMENQQKVLENNLKKFLDLKRELSFLQHEAEESDRVVNDFIKAVVPNFSTLSRANKSSVSGEVGDTLEDLSSFQDESQYTGQTLPIPSVQYEWGDAFTSSSPVGRYSCSTISRGQSRLDELKLNLVFDVNSRQLPTKLQLEIKDKAGRVVFRKRQDLYYVKVQERVSTLDAADDYIMTVTTISGPSKTSEDVRIHNKYYQEEVEESPSCSLPLLDTCRSPSPASNTSGFDERSIDSIFSSPLRQIEAVYDEVCREVSETPLPDLEEIVSLDLAPASVPAPAPAPISVLEKKTAAFLLVKKPIVPEVVFKWQRGFRRDNTGRYSKVTILKLQFKYEESQKLLPTNLRVSPVSGETEEEDFVKTVSVTDNAATLEFLIEDKDEVKGDHLRLRVSSKERDGGDHLSAPPFSLEVASLSLVTLGEWHLAEPTLLLQY